MAAFTHLLLSFAAAIALASANGFVLSPEDPEVVKVANYAVRTYNQIDNDIYAYKLISVQSVNSQMYPPSRVKFSLSATVGQTVCKNRADVNLADCALHGKTMTCDFVVLAVPNSDIPSHLLKSQCK